VLEVLLQAGFSEAYGARPLKRAIDRLVLLPLARRIAAEPQLRDQLLEFQAPQGRIEIESIPLGPSPTANVPRVELPEEVLEWETAEPAPAPPLSLRQLESRIAGLQERLDRHVRSEHFERLVSLKEALLEEMLQPSFWDDQEHAHAVNRTIYHLDRITNQILDLQRLDDRGSHPHPSLARGRRAGIRELGADPARHVRGMGAAPRLRGRDRGWHGNRRDGARRQPGSHPGRRGRYPQAADRRDQG
jgi:signal transduction histidine kinase